MKNNEYNEYNAKPVLAKLERMIKFGNKRLIRDVCDDLSIFDWWPDYLTLSHMKQMRTFLREAIKLGYNGYVCFKVGARGCANGMWAYVDPTTTGYSPNCDTLYRSFTPDYTYYSFSKNGKWYPNLDGKDYNSLKTIKLLEEAIQKIK